jgi:hypothetical protein
MVSKGKSVHSRPLYVLMETGPANSHKPVQSVVTVDNAMTMGQNPRLMRLAKV